MGKEFRPMLAPTESPWTYSPPASSKLGLDKVARLPMLLVLGSVAQCILSVALPPRWAVVPLFSYLAVSAVSFLLNSAAKPGPLPVDVVPGRVAAQLPRADDGCVLAGESQGHF
ncbi:hypothetical protein NLG97_g9251 [Lecanicillium saksenae]|uniref:Uncharacterized protein n=1 Tax=Lecanicillium saksenae TaxID=468837 RepID=A0ACC1QGS2_9HYPO|nr:hypothetical protein NLG97_g9251 [Lecanicillium saksenae]